MKSSSLSTDHPELKPVSGAFQHADAVAAGLRFHYLHQGAGFPVILLSGFPQSSYAWRKVIPDLAADYRVIAPDLPGQGDSDRPTDGYDTSTVSQRLDLFLTELGLDRFHLVGHDVGAWVAFTYAATFRSRIETLTLIDAGIPGISLRPEIRLQEARNRWHFLFQQVPELAETLVAGREEAYISWFFRNKAARADVFSDADVREYFRVYSAPGAMTASFKFYQAVPESMEQNRALAAKKFAFPVLAIGGEHGSTPNIGKDLLPIAPNTLGLMFPCGHYVPEEEPERLVRELRAFFAAAGR
ncbi:MAG TPA: alpha/beta hydrolase [Chthoniobacterales bacterium]|jgi:pimeloyl-ACP methyl ester carboxylesterase|nr:alpha/beta hydrolase [Chthoniobacterales bacterium]